MVYGGRKEDQAITGKRNFWAQLGALIIFGSLTLAPGELIPAAGAAGAGVEVRRLGLSRVGDTTMLTVVLDRPVEPRLSTSSIGAKPLLVAEFPQGRGLRLPSRLEGDDLLVERVLTEAAPQGVRIILEIFPDQPYTFWKRLQKGPGGQTLWILGLNADPAAGPPRPRPPESTGPPGAPMERQPEAPAPAPEDYGLKESDRVAGSPGTFAELKNLMPKAAGLFQGLESEGWAISEFHSYDRPGQRFSRDFLLVHRQYPELAVKIVYLPGNTPNTPNVSIITLTTDRLGGESADKYRQMRKMSFAEIKKDHEDIGDFFDDALKPLRVKLREETKAIMLRDAQVFQNFINRSTRNPMVAEKIMNHAKEKVNQRFEGVQYTISENPLVLFNLMDFLYVRVYFLEMR